MEPSWVDGRFVCAFKDCTDPPRHEWWTFAELGSLPYALVCDADRASLLLEGFPATEFLPGYLVSPAHWTRAG